MNDSRRDDRVAPNDTTTHTHPDGAHDASLDPHTTALEGGRPVPPVERDAETATAPTGEGARSTDRDATDEPPELRPAVLGRLEGLGLITRLRDAGGGVIDADGSWRPADDTATLDELRETFPEGSVTTFAGAMVEARHDGPGEDVSMQVVITRHGEYEDYDGRAVRVVNFVPRGA